MTARGEPERNRIKYTQHRKKRQDAAKKNQMRP
jgi:hypothetical protein